MNEPLDDPELLRFAEAIADERRLLDLDVPSDAPAGIADCFRIIEETAAAYRGSSAGGPVKAPPGDTMRWGDLLILRPLGNGSFGEVYAAWDATLEREVALKLRPPEAGVLRWLDEARNLARVRHHNVLTIHGADLRDSRAGIWTELLRGRTLEDELTARGPFSPLEAARIGLDLAGALTAVHAAGLVHGDVKTSNVMLEFGDGIAARPRVVLMDFGAAHEMPGIARTERFDLMGTPLVLAPEVLEGGDPTASSDIYALGALLYRLLTGRYPVEAKSLPELLDKHRSGERIPLRAIPGKASLKLARIVDRATEWSPGRRFDSAHAMKAAIEDIVEPGRVTRNRLTWTAVALTGLAVVAGGIGGWAALRRQPIVRRAAPQPTQPSLFQSAGWVVGSSEASGLGWEMCGVGDVNGDALDDVLIAEPEFSQDFESQGRVQLFLGRTGGPDSLAAWSALGHSKGANFGGQVSKAGDVNHDGFDDVLVVERNFERDHRTLGAVMLYMGSRRGLSQEPAWAVEGDGHDGIPGHGVTGLGDVNGDGFDDVLVSEPTQAADLRGEGVARLYLGTPGGLSGSPAWEVHGGSEGANLGLGVGPAGDINGDGFDDILLGAPWWSHPAQACGILRLYSGGPSGPGAAPNWILEGGAEQEHLGWMVCGAGDVDGDGYDDLLAGGPGYSSGGVQARGRVVMFRGGPQGPGRHPDWSFPGFSTAARLGTTLGGLGDVDGDGLSDILVGAPYQSSSIKSEACGYVAVFLGGKRHPTTVPAWSLAPTEAGLLTGSGLAAAGDVNGDGLNDLLVGASGFSGSFARQGRVTLFLSTGRLHHQRARAAGR